MNGAVANCDISAGEEIFYTTLRKIASIVRVDITGNIAQGKQLI